MSGNPKKKLKEAADKLRKWREDPVAFVREVFGVEPDPWQKDILTAFPAQRRIAMQACKGPGKTATLAWISWNFLLTRPSPKIAATSITADNLADNLWPEMAKWQARSPLLKEMFLWTKTRIVNRQEPENWFMSARSWPKTGDSTQQADTLAGLHADYLMFLLDESGGIPDAVMAAAEAGLASGIECKIVQAGNPTMLSGPLYRASTTERNLWYVVEITGDPDDPKRTPRVSVQWAREQIEKYGRDNPWVLVNVFGKFPPSSLNSLFSAEDIDAAMNRMLKDVDYRHAQKRLGIDVARFGDDKTIILPRQGLRIFQWEELRNADSYTIANAIATCKSKERSEVEFIDDTGGYSAGVQDIYNTQAKGSSLIPVNFSSKATDPRYMNIRAEMYFRFADWIKRGAIPKSAELKRQLLAQRYFFSGNRMQLLDKEQIKQELQGQSPDEADAMALTFAHPEALTMGDSIEIAPGVRISASRGLVYDGGYDRNAMDADPFSDAKMREIFGD